MKICSKCKNIKDFSEFSPNKLGRDGLRSQCKECCRLIHRKRYDEGRRYNTLKYYYTNLEKIKKRKKEYYIENKEKIQDYHKRYTKNRRTNDDLYKLSINIRVLIGASFRNKGLKKSAKTVNILGCSVPEFKKYIESKWEDWMNWENYGKYNGEFSHGWDLDHIIPVNTAKTKEDLIRLNYFKNLQPLCSKINRDIKWNKTE